LSAVQTFFTGTLAPAITSGLASVGSIIGLSGTAAIAGGAALVVGAAVAAVAAITAAVTHWDDIKKSLKRLAALPGDYQVYSGHGPATTLETERRTNPYMR